jgi:hypothetical protein
MRLANPQEAPLIAMHTVPRLLWSLSLCGVLAATASGCSEPAADAAPCASDVDCKGDRVCVDAACVDGSTGSGGAASSSATSSSGGAVEGAPSFLSFAASTTTLRGPIEDEEGRGTPGESVTFTAVLTDPQGIDDLIGGTLKDSEGTTYGAFVTSAQEGAYEITVSWAQIHQASSVSFAQETTLARTFVAEFFDQAGHPAAQTQVVDLTCDGWAACDGVCKDWKNDLTACGECGTSCSGCDHGACYTTQNCFASNGDTCAALCATVGTMCSSACGQTGSGDGFAMITHDNPLCEFGTTRFDYKDSCEDTGWDFVQCCCSVPPFP